MSKSDNSVRLLDREETVISVPHSGTRSLCEYLWPGAEKYNYVHWGQNDADIADYEGKVHIPIRNPINIARTWDGRYPSADKQNGNHGIDNMLWRLEEMIKFIATYHDRTLWHMEDIDICVGRGEERHDEESARVKATRKWLQDKMWFYGQYYDFE